METYKLITNHNVRIDNAGVRTEELEGVKYTVCPAVIMNEGVWSGDQGPIYYGKEDHIRSIDCYNGRSAVCYHPSLKGKGVSANNPSVIERQKIGLVFNTKWDEKVKTEIWINPDKADKVDKRIMESVRAGLPMEVSVGVTGEVIKEEGTFNGKPYKYRAINLRPDHVALLPDKEGAFSIRDGGGMLRNEAGVVTPLQGALESLLVTKYGEGKVEITNIENNWVAFSEGSQLYLMQYTATDTDAKLVGDRQPVQKVVSYKTTDGKTTLVRNEEGSLIPQVEKAPMATTFDAAAHVTKLIGNGWAEADREFLEGLGKTNPGQLEKIQPKAKDQPAPQPSPTPIQNNEVLTEEQEVVKYIAAAPVGLRPVLAASYKTRKDHRAALIGNVKKTPAGANLTDAQFAALDDAVLETMGLLAQPTPTQINNQGVEQFLNGNPFGRINYAGAQGGAEIINNAAGDTEVLEDVDVYSVAKGKTAAAKA